VEKLRQEKEKPSFLRAMDKQVIKSAYPAESNGQPVGFYAAPLGNYYPCLQDTKTPDELPGLLKITKNGKTYAFTAAAATGGAAAGTVPAGTAAPKVSVCTTCSGPDVTVYGVVLVSDLPVTGCWVSSSV
jgi:hypothetical protein